MLFFGRNHNNFNFFLPRAAKNEKNDFLSSALRRKRTHRNDAPRAAFAARGALSCCGHAAVPHCGYASAPIYAGAARNFFPVGPGFCSRFFFKYVLAKKY